MARRLGMPIAGLVALGLAALVSATGCGGDESTSTQASADGHPILDHAAEIAVDAAGRLSSAASGTRADRVRELARSAATADGAAALTIDYPPDGAIFPPEFIAPTFLWHDPAEGVDTWLIAITFAGAESESIQVVVPGRPAPTGEIDTEALGPTNEVYPGTDYQRSAVSWRPGRELWEQIKARAVEVPATLAFTGFASADPGRPASRGSIRIQTARDPVGAPIFYRDVPLMPSVGESGRIQPLSQDSMHLIAWRMRDVSRDDTKVVLKGMASCGNCHSFSLDGKTLGMDVDGPQGDKGTYAVKALSKETVIDYEDVITWNSFADKPKDHKTIGFLSRMSPDGQFVVTTVNESLYVSNFKDFKFLQVFYPTRGILAYYSRASREMKALPGADDPEFVHCDPAWTPDGRYLIFARARAFDPYIEGRPLARFPNDPNEPQVQYDLYRIPFNDGKGGTPVRVQGASQNGMSNTFPKVSPDGKWIVFTQNKNGQLLRPDSKLRIVPLAGGESREMRCNKSRMNSWHSFSPNSQWMVFSSKENTPYTQAFLTHIDENGHDSPGILIPNCTAANRAVNLPEFLNAPYDALDSIRVPAVKHHIEFWKGTDLVSGGEYEKGIACLRKALEAEPTFARAHVNLGVAFVRLGRLEEAVAEFDKALASTPRDYLANFNLGLALLDLKRPDRAIPPLECVLELNPNHLEVRRALATAYADTGRSDQAIAQCRTVLARQPAHASTARLLATLLLRTGRVKEAVEGLGQATKVLPEDAELLTMLAWVLATHPDDQVRDGARAVRLATRAQELTRRGRPEPIDALAAALAAVGRFEDAARVVAEGIAVARRVSPRDVASMESRLALYRAGKPFRLEAKR